MMTSDECLDASSGDRKRMTGRPVVRAEAEEEIEGVGDSCK